MMDFNEFSERLGLEMDEYIELIELFIDTSQADLDNLEAAIAARAADETAKAAHSLKGASGSLGLSDISEIARRVEKNARQGSLDGAVESVDEMKKKISELGEIIGG